MEEDEEAEMEGGRYRDIGRYRENQEGRVRDR
jgi:hypothetical protein